MRRTVKEIVGDMRESADKLSVSAPAISSMLKTYADELSAAHEETEDEIEQYRSGLDWIHDICNGMDKDNVYQGCELILGVYQEVM